MWQALELAVAPPPSPPSRRRGERSRGGGEALEGGEAEAVQAAVQEADGEGGASTGTVSTLTGEAAATGEGGVKPPGPAARRALASFHQLVTGFRAEVEQATAAEAAEAAAAEAAAAAAAEAGTAGGEGAAGARRAEREDARSAAAVERLDLPGSGTRQRAEGGDVAAAVRRRTNGEARERGSARGDDGWAEEPGGLAGLFRALVRQSGYEAMVRGAEGEPAPRPRP